MKPKTLILMVVAVTCGLGASYMTSRLLAERGQEAAPETVNVLVAKANLDLGKPLKNPEVLFEEKSYIKDQEPKNAIKKMDDLKGRVLKRPLRAGDFVTAEDLLGERESFMQHNLPKGHVAVGIRVSMESSASGWATLPLNRVNIMLSVKRGGDKDFFSMTLLENVLVLAADTNAARLEGNGAMPASVVTVALTPEDAHKVNLARDLGTLTLVLRQFDDHRIGAFQGKMTVEDLLTKFGVGQKEVTETVEVTPYPKADESLPPLPPVIAEKQPVVEKKAEPVVVAQVPELPKGTLHKLRIWQGDQQKVVEFWLGEDGQVIEHDVQRSEVNAPPPPRPQPPAVPAQPAPVPEK